MEGRKWSSYFWKLLWVVGLVILAYVSFNYETQIRQKANETYNLLPFIWTRFFISIIFGFYISLISVKKWSFNMNHSLLWCVAIPCLLISISFPLLSTLASSDSLPEYIANSSLAYWLANMNHSSIFGILTSLTMVMSIFNNQRSA